VAAAVAVVALVAGLMAVALPARAQQEPYSGGTPGGESEAQLVMALSVGSGPPGSNVVVEATGFKNNGDTATITFGGTVVKTSTASTSTSTGLAVVRPAALLALADAVLPGRLTALRGQASTKPSIRETIQVPNVGAGTYDVCVSAANAQTACAPFRVTSETRVLGVQFSRGDSGGGVRGLARTGFMLLPFLLLAVILILVGRYLVAKSRARRV
jgi:hypothetical protein